MVRKVRSDLLNARPDKAVEEKPVLLLLQGNRALLAALLVIEPREEYIDCSWPLVRKDGMRDLVDWDLLKLISYLYRHADVDRLGEEESRLSCDAYIQRPS